MPAVSEADAQVQGKIDWHFAGDVAAVNFNGLTGTVTVADNASLLANSDLVTSTLTAADGTSYAESSIISKGNSTYLNGNYWWTNGTSIQSISNALSYMMTNSTPTGTFNCTTPFYNGYDTTSIKTWLGSDSSSYSGTNKNFEDGIVQFYGYITIPTNNTVLQLASDDGGS